MPDFKDGSIARKQFAQLLPVNPDVLRRPVSCLIAIPRRDIDTKLQAVARRRVRNLLDNVAFTALIRTVPDGMVCRVRGPQTESIVMLAGENDAFAPGGF